MNYQLYLVNSDYTNYLRKYDYRVELKNDRPYLGIVFKFNGYNYFAPLTSEKETNYLRNKIYKSIVIDIGKLKNKPQQLGFVRINNMIPVPHKCLTKIKISLNNSCPDYNYLLLNQYFIFTSEKFCKEVNIKTQRVYKISSNKKHYLNKYVCDFKLLEDKCDKWL